ncbi:TNF receptor-associated factor 1-like [Stylophora pistillata]|uniref:TNF receptor-associated factor 1-like n=1 Tax=Stylophora pistillata TaxID=50429 RepID=UPI000C053597|nr:TNF receptor-associated factor 1-like [Stylophora pistillata]
MPGFRVSEVDKDRLKSEYFCRICELVLRDPIQTESGVFICRSCHCQGNSPVLTHCSDGQVLAEREVPRCNQLGREILSLVVSCTSQGCLWQGKLRDLEKHTSASCGFVMVRCVHSACGVRIRLCHLSHHLQNECVFGLVRCTICGKEVSRNMLKKHRAKFHSNVYFEIDILRDELDIISKTQQDLKAQLEQIKSEHRLNLQAFPSYDGQLLWKITDYTRRRNDAVTGQQVSLYSPCFYASRYGYKMCARIFLNGDGMGKGTHISIFIVVMRGQYDALLRWPFRQKVTFMLLDQDNVEHVIDAFRPDPNSSSFQRPRREMNIASGCPMFCPLAELNNHAYVRDDTMFLKIILDTSDL